MDVTNLANVQVEFTSQLTTNLSNAINQQLSNTQDILSNLIIQEGDVWVSNAIESVVQNTVELVNLNEIATQLESNQSIVISDSSGIYNGINQHTVQNIVSDYIAKYQVDINNNINEYVAIINDIVSDQSSLNAIGELAISTVSTYLNVADTIASYSFYGSLIVIVVLFIAIFVNMFTKQYSMVHQDWNRYVSKNRQMVQ